MAFDFPNSPIDGQQYSPAGGPDYIFRSASGAWEIQTSGTNSAFVAKAGDTMTGQLVLPSVPAPVAGNAVRKDYVDAGDANLNNAKVNRAGDTMTADLVINGGGVRVSTGFTASGDYGVLSLNTTHVGYGTDIYGAFNNKTRWLIRMGEGSPETGGNVGSDFAITAYEDAGVNGLYAPLHIRRSTGQTTLRNLLIKGEAYASFSMQKTGSGQANQIYGNSGANPRWAIKIGDETAESGGNAGSDLAFLRFGDAGGYLGNPLLIKRLNGEAIFNGYITLNCPSGGGINVTTPGVADCALALKKGAAGAANTITGATGNSSRWIMCLGNWNNETSYNVGSDFMLYRCDGGGNLWDAPIQIPRETGQVVCSNLFWPNGGIYMVNINNRWTPDGNLVVSARGYCPGGGSWIDISDARTKNVEAEYKRGLDDIAKLNPMIYTFKANETPEPPAWKPLPKKFDPEGKEIPEPQRKAPTTAPYENSHHHDVAVAAKPFVGLIAQDVDQVMPEMVTKRAGFIDGVEVPDIHELDTTPLIYALLNAVKELKARVEQLEAAAA
jgi:hypothetical protein